MTHLNKHGLWWCLEMISSSNKDELTLALLILTISAVILVYKFRLTIWRSRPPLPPGPLSLPIVGYLPFLTPDLHKQFTNMAQIYGPIFKFYVGNKLKVVINTPELVKEVVRDQDEIFANRGQTIASSVLTYGGQDIAFAKNDSNWRKLRKIFVHEVLSIKNLEACGSFRRDEVRRTIRNVFNKVGGTAVNISKIAFFTEANVIKRMVWEDSFDESAKDSHLDDELQLVVSKIVALIRKPNLSDFFPILAWFDLQGVERDMKRELKKLEHIYTRIIDHRIESNNKMPEDGTSDARKKDFLQILLDLKGKNDATSLNIIQIKSILMDIMIGGTETTIALIEWAMAEIIKNHKVMKRIQEELAEIVGINNIVEEYHLLKLEYLDATIRETFRLHTVGPLVPRWPNQDCMVGGYTIPKGCNVILNVWAIHRDPRYWDNPLEFNPERFLSYEGANKFDYNGNNMKFMPFGSGRRVCPGIPLAQKMQMYILASLLHSFDWRLPEGEEHDLSEKFGSTLKKKKQLIAIPYQRLPDVSLYM